MEKWKAWWERWVGGDSLSELLISVWNKGPARLSVNWGDDNKQDIQDK